MTLTDDERAKALHYILSNGPMSKWEHMIWNAALDRAAQTCEAEAVKYDQNKTTGRSRFADDHGASGCRRCAEVVRTLIDAQKGGES